MAGSGTAEPRLVGAIVAHGFTRMNTDLRPLAPRSRYGPLGSGSAPRTVRGIVECCQYRIREEYGGISA